VHLQFDQQYAVDFPSNDEIVIKNGAVLARNKMPSAFLQNKNCFLVYAKSLNKGKLFGASTVH
jgi:hypothetical protein